MQYDFAPMEGLTTYTYRNAHAKYFPGIHHYFAPFIGSMHMSSRDINGILPENNRGLTLVPQILTNKADEFLTIANVLQDYGYTSVNLNLGCPSGTVVAKHRGAGFLEDTLELERFLDEIFEKCPLKISIKTRIGMEFLSEWEDLVAIYARFPLEELIIHPRLRKEFYNGTPHNEAYALAASLPFPVCANGDILSRESLDAVREELPALDHVMIGRGLLRRPWLVQELAGDSPEYSVSKERVLDFHNEILEGCCQIMSGEQPVLYKMKDLWTHLSGSFTNPEKYLKKIRKANRLSEYKIEVAKLFREQSLLL